MKKPMNESDQFNAEQLEKYRRTAERLLEQAVAERTPGDQLTKPTSTQIQFDWDALITDGGWTFHLGIKRGDQHSLIDFTIDLNKLAPTARERLDSFIARRQAGLRDDHDLALHLSWLLETWLMQVQPEISTRERQRRVRQLLLIESPSEKSDPPIRSEPAKSIKPTINPLLALVTKRERNRLRRSHQIEVENLERESEQLYASLSRLAKMTEADFWPAAEAFNSALLAHHKKVKRAGILLNNPMGRLLAIEAGLVIRNLIVEAEKIKARQK
jgi:hypothetical protein